MKQQDGNIYIIDNTNVVVLGGYEHNYETTATVCMFDTINNVWIELPEMPTPRRGHAVGIAGSNIIAAGGHNGVDPYSHMEGSCKHE